MVSVARPAGPVEVMLTRYRRYLLVERGVTKETARLYVTAIRPFVASFERAGRLELERVTGGGVSAFVLAEAQRRRGTSVRSVATALRSLLGFLQLDGVLQESLTGAVPGVGAWRLAGLPSPLERGELRRGRLQPG